jgi:uncharacterized protein
VVLSHGGRLAEFDPVSLAFRPLDADGGASEPGPLPDALPPVPAEPAESAWRRGRRLERLVVNVANYCNLDCVYCYAQGGDYGGPHEQMSEAVGALAVQRFFDLYDQVSMIQFFGGEPLLNLPAIEGICQRTAELCESRGLARPALTVITNGTVLNPRILEVVRRYDIKVTVSVDGPPAINDRLRLARAGASGSVSRLVEENVRRMQEETGQPIQAEGTYTRLHVQERCSVGDVLDYVHDQLGIGQLNMPVNAIGTAERHDPLALGEEEADSVAASYADAVTRTVRSLVEEPLERVRILRAALDIVEPLLDPRRAASPFICPAGNGTIAVDSNGDVYPCFMFYRQPGFRFGSVLGPAAPPLADGAQAVFVGDMRPGKIEPVRGSWARRFVRVCAGGNYFRNGHHGTVSPWEVRLIEAMASAAVVELAHLSRDRDRWQYLPLALRLSKMYFLAPES